MFKPRSERRSNWSGSEEKLNYWSLCVFAMHFPILLDSMTDLQKETSFEWFFHLVISSLYNLSPSLLFDLGPCISEVDGRVGGKVCDEPNRPVQLPDVLY